MTTFFVTGGRGYIGSAFTEAAEKAGHHVLTYDAIDGQDIANGTQLNDMMRAVKPDVVIHLAATPGVSTGEKTLGAECFRDIANTRNVLQAMQLSDCKRIVFMSTASVYGNQGDVILLEEDPPMQQTGYYAASKLAIEGLLGAWQKATPGSSVGIIRLGTVIGPGNRKGFIKDWVRKLKQDPTRLEILGDGTQVKSYIHIEDLARAMLTIAKQIDGYTLVNVATAAMRTNDAIGLVVEAMGITKSPEIVRGTDKTGFFGDVTHLRIDTDRLRNGFDFDPLFTPGDAVRQNVQWLLEHPEVFG